MQRQTLEMSPKEELQFRMDQSEKDMLIKNIFLPRIFFGGYPI